MKIYITGCAKSGTTLLARLFWAFEGLYVIKEETRPYDFLMADDNLVGKRTHNTLFGGALLNREEILLQKLLLSEFTVVNIVRDGRDVIKSFEDDWGVNGCFEWMNAINQAIDHGDLIDHHIRYEDIINIPNGAQTVVAEELDLKIIHKWSDYPKFYDTDQLGMGSYAPRPLSDDRIGKAPERYKQVINDEHAFEALLKQHGYL